MDILVVENVWMGKAKYGLFDKTILTAFSILPMLYARQIAAITPNKHNVKVINERYENIDFEKSYDIVNINFTASTTPRAYQIADEFRKRKTTVVLSGIQASSIPNEAKNHADSVILGRGELGWLDLLNDFEKGNTKPFYKDRKYDKSEKIPPTNVRLPGFVLTGAVEATRGCPYKCDFCPEVNVSCYTNFYKRPVDEVINEIKKIPQKSIMFYDSSLTIDVDYTTELFTKMIDLKKKFFCNGNVDVLANNADFVKLSKKAGCISWLIGFESLSQKTLESVNKKTNKVVEYKKAVENIHKNKMAVIGCFMFGFDTDTKDTFYNTLKTIKQLKIDVADFCVLTPFPGTPTYKRFEQEGRILSRDWSKYNLKTPVFKPKNMTGDELSQGLINIYTQFYSTNYTIRRAISALKLGFYPFLLVLGRNLIAKMNARVLSVKNHA